MPKPKTFRVPKDPTKRLMQIIMGGIDNKPSYHTNYAIIGVRISDGHTLLISYPDSEDLMAFTDREHAQRSLDAMPKTTKASHWRVVTLHEALNEIGRDTVIKEGMN